MRSQYMKIGGLLSSRQEQNHKTIKRVYDFACKGLMHKREQKHYRTSLHLSCEAHDSQKSTSIFQKWNLQSPRCGSAHISRPPTKFSCLTTFKGKPVFESQRKQKRKRTRKFSFVLLLYIHSCFCPVIRTGYQRYGYVQSRL